ncbi:hypothetical protein BJ878DRAFT_541838 [Calycina marina]|uniref:Uncharacterized protein n=1 Tax=Calycina marina TaxID=1763456 RepID=A0A9P7Z495_9HELO|nr:hypothetical protein BJ878DRAFT_541838 [Calycina marina]
MSDPSSGRPRLGATFIPGGDDFSMPELVSPAPQRIMPEVPSNMQDQLAHLELEDRTPQGHRMSSASTATSSIPNYQHGSNTRDSSGSSISTIQKPSAPGFTASYDHTNAEAYQNLNRSSLLRFGAVLDSPRFSPFPKLRDAGVNVPLSDDEKEEVLERARPVVLKSTDPEIQLAWAQDALTWVELAVANYNRIQQTDGLNSRSMTPKIEHELKEDAISIVSFLAEQHHPKAEFMKGMWLEFGKFGNRVDKKESLQCYKRSADRNFARTQYRMGMYYETSNNVLKAIEHYQKGVDMEDSASNYRLGMMTLLGQHDTPRDHQRGVDLIRFAADTADENAPQGAYVYGMLLARELPMFSIPEYCLPYDLNDAKLYIEKAAYLGFSKAQLKMAQAYELCQLGCEFDPALSLHYNALAARQGESEADMAISKWFLCGYESIFEKNEKLAFTYAKRAAATNMPTAEFALGYFYEIGMYVPVDLRESEKWYIKAAEHGNKDALGRIDSIKKNNTFSKQDHVEMAIRRIRSQHGSQRGGRPERFKQRTAPLPVIDDILDMPDPRDSYGSPNPSSIPRRTVSVAPYPEDDWSIDHHGQGPQYAGRGNLRPGPHSDRPSSAFGIRPLSRSSEQYSLSSPVEAARPSSSQGGTYPPNGRGRNRAAKPSAPSGSWESQVPQNYRQPTPSQAPWLPPLEQTRPLNIGPGLHEPNKLQKSSPAMNNPQPHPPQMSGGHGYDASRGSAPQPQYNGTTSMKVDLTKNSYGRGSTMSSPNPVMSPQQHQSFRQYSTPVQSPVSTGSTQSRISQRPPQQTMSSQSTQSHTHSLSSAASMGPPTQKPQGNTSSSGGPVPPKKQGPATFEEMGIPHVKETNECIVM